MLTVTSIVALGSIAASKWRLNKPLLQNLAPALVGLGIFSVSNLADAKDRSIVDTAIIGAFMGVIIGAFGLVIAWLRKRGDSDGAREVALAKVGKGGFTPLMFYAVEGDLDMASKVLATGLDVNSKNASGMTALMFAAANGRSEFALWLIGRGARTDEKSSKGKSAADYAKERGHLELEKLLRVEKPI